MEDFLIHDSFITLPWRLERSPPRFETNEIKYPEALVRYFLQKYTRPGDKIFDPFAGLGTTLFTAEEMRRLPFGLEYDDRRYEWVASQLGDPQNLIHGDSGKLSTYGFPKMDFAMTSPPYMPRHHRWNPLYAGNPGYAGYDAYLKQMARIFRQLATIMKRNAYVVVQADNLQGRGYTPLVADLGRTISANLRLQTEIIIAWQGQPETDAQHTHCLIFKN